MRPVFEKFGHVWGSFLLDCVPVQDDDDDEEDDYLRDLDQQAVVNAGTGQGGEWTTASYCAADALCCVVSL